MASAYNAILLSHKNTELLIKWNILDGYHNYYAEWRKPDQKEYLLNNSTYIKCQNIQSTSLWQKAGSLLSGGRAESGKEGVIGKWTNKKDRLQRDMKKLLEIILKKYSYLSVVVA